MVRSEVFSWVNLIHKQHIDFMILLDRFYLGTDHLTCKGGGYGFLFRSEICLRTTRELEYLFFFQNLTLGYMIKTLNQIIIFFLHQNQNIFFSNIENQNTMTDVAHTNDTAVTSFE
jgi:hypothetical protein